MQVVLLERVEKLGQMGDVVRVKPGFARNFLLPQKKALRATKENMERFEKQRAQLEANNLKLKGEAEAVAKKLDGLSIVLVRQAGETGQLYGSVTARDIAEAVSAAGFTVDHRQVRIDRPIKTLGLVQTRVMLHPEVASTITVNVAKSEEEAERQAAGEAPAAEEIFETAPAAGEAGGEAAPETEAKAEGEKPAKAKKAKKEKGGEAKAEASAAAADAASEEKSKAKKSKGKKAKADDAE
ncbi:MAG: 50S ribosomal protein L9 [Alphaproteobacteria bacterium]|nr:50S ribosomal protein L9 [Alphaproteobacteria bacterium]